MTTESPGKEPKLSKGEEIPAEENPTQVLLSLRTACTKTAAAVGEVLAAHEQQLGVHSMVKDYLGGHAKSLGLDDNITRGLDTYAELTLYVTLEAKEGFDWNDQLKAAKNTINIVNNANEGVNLETNYDLPTLIKALVAQNKPEQLYANIERMQQPTLVIAPAGLALEHFNGPLGPNGREGDYVTEEPFMSDYLAPTDQREQASVYLIDAGDLSDMSTQPQVVQNHATDNRNRLSDQRLREEMEKLGIRLDEHGWGMLATMLRNQDSPVCLDAEVYSLLFRHFADTPNRVAYAYFYNVQFYFSALDNTLPRGRARLRGSVMAEL